MTNRKNLSSLEETILDLLEKNLDERMPIVLIQDFLRFSSKKEQKRLQKAINRLVSLNLAKKDGHMLALPKIIAQREEKEDKGTVSGIVDITMRGAGYVSVDGWEEDIKISPNQLGLALQNDVVKVKVQGVNKRSGKPQGKVLSILKRGKDFYVGTLQQVGPEQFLIETDKKSAHVNFFVVKEFLNGAKHNDKVLFALESWVHPKALPEAKIAQVLGKKGSNDANVLSILAESDLRSDFPDQIEAFADEIPIEIDEKECARRRDIRDEIVFTIDPLDAKDFDDALSIEVLENGNYYLGVHIADVTHYMPRNSVLDKEAYERGTSVYLVDRVIPMLPERLSNGVCSLRPHEDKFTYSCFMEVSEHAEVLDYSIEETVIHSKQRFTYEQAQAIIDGEEHELRDKVMDAAHVAKILMDKRFKEGAIDFDSPEPRFVLDEEGKPVEVILKKRLFAHRLIEECMLLANRTVSEYIDERRKQSGKKRNKDLFPFFYRVHDKPDLEKLANVAEQVRPLGIEFEVSKKLQPNHINELLSNVRGTAYESIINGLTLRAMAKAVYSPDNQGHFGLGFKHYAHFTSPIRRYPDVIVHRMLKAYHKEETSYSHKELLKSGEHCSERERVAVEAERDSIKLKQVEFLSDKIGEEFAGTISGVTERGLFVILDDIYCEGMIRVGRLKGDYYIYDERSHSLIGRASGKRYQLGDKIDIKVEQTDLEKRQIDFDLA